MELTIIISIALMTYMLGYSVGKLKGAESLARENIEFLEHFKAIIGFYEKREMESKQKRKPGRPRKKKD